MHSYVWKYVFPRNIRIWTKLLFWGGGGGHQKSLKKIYRPHAVLKISNTPCIQLAQIAEIFTGDGSKKV